MATIAVDFDGVLHDVRPVVRPAGKRMGPPIAGAKQAMQMLHDLGHELIIYTCRARTSNSIPASTAHVEDWLEYFQIPFDSVTALKPVAAVYVDDHGLYFERWSDALVEILARIYAEG